MRINFNNLQKENRGKNELKFRKLSIISLLVISLLILINISFVSAVDIVFDDFEDGSLVEWSLSHTGGADDWASVTINPYQGSFHAQSRPRDAGEISAMERTISTSGYNDIKFSYYRRLIGLDTADWFRVKWYDGSIWTTTEEQNSENGDYVYKEFSLPVSAEDNANFVIKFECVAGAVSEYCRVDNVNISGSVSCQENLQNTSWTSWVNNGSCKIDDLQEQVRNRTQYDANNCGYVNTTIYDYQNISCDYCTPNRVNTTWSDWYYLESCQIDDLRDKQRNLTEYDENNCYAITGLPSDLSENVTYFENSSDVCDYCFYSVVNSSWSGWENYGSCLIDDNQQQNRSKTEYDENYDTCYVITGLPSDLWNSGNNNTYWEWQNISCDYCSYDVQNTTKSDWYFIESCQTDDTRIRQRNWTEYDANYPTCYAITGLPGDLWNDGNNNTYFENESTVCDYCFYSVVNSSWSGWENYGSCLIDDNQQQNRSKTEYDENYDTCYVITGLPSDLWNSGNNNTYWEWQNISCDYCTPNMQNTTKTAWNNMSCSGEQMNQSRSWIEYDVNDCGEIENTTYWEYQLVGPTYINTSWSEWGDISCLIGDVMNQSRNLTQYDIYACAGNTTFIEYRQTESCDYCTPNLVNSSWSEWIDDGSCLANNTQVQIRNKTQYDLNNCGEIENQTIYDYQIISCDYCTPNLINTTKTSWQDQEECLIDDNQQQNRSWVEYDVNNCEEVENVTYWEYQNISCDYCTPNRVNTTWSDWYYLESCQVDDLREKQRNLTEYDENNCYVITGLPSDLSENTTFFENSSDVCDFLTIICEVGGPYQQGALALFIGNVSNDTGILIGEDVNISLYQNSELNLSRILQTSEDGDFETSFSNLSSGSYIVNASVSYLGVNETCSKAFQVGSAGSFVLDKIANIHNLSNTEIYYNISLRVLNKGGADCINVSLVDSDFILSPYDLGTINPSESVVVSYLKNFTRQNTTTYYALSIANVEGIDSYSNSLISANSSSMNLTIPASTYAIGKQLVITKNIIFVEETSLNITYNVSSTLYNTGDEDLFNVVYTDTDIDSSSLLLDLSRGESRGFASLVVIDKAASNIEYEFELGTAVIDSLSFYSNRPKVKIPGYGGPADAIVSAPVSVPVSTSFNTKITIENQNPDIGQDFTIDYWITNNDESVNYSSGQQTIYVSALGSSNLTASLTSPGSAGTYRFRALVSWVGGSASSFDSFEVVGEEEAPPAPPEGGGRIIEEEEGVNVTVEVEGVEEIEEVEGEGEGIVCNPPYIRYGRECCLDENDNLICDEDEKVDKGITGRFVDNLNNININYAWLGLIILLLILIFVSYKALRKLLPKILAKHPRKKNNIMRLKAVKGLRVYTSDGFEIGKVKEVFIGENRVDSLKIKFSKKIKSKNKGFLLNYNHIFNIGDIVFVDERVSKEIKLVDTDSEKHLKATKSNI